jgi:serine/threonine protein phosphatase PrpC
VVLYLNGPEAYWAHVGDSRLYHFRKGKLINRTQDHSVAQLMVAQGRLKETDAATSVLQNQLYMRLGGNELPEPDFGASEVEADDLFMLCSDGFWSHVEPDEVLSSLEGIPIDNEGADHLVTLARERGGATGDNISLALIKWIPGRVEAGTGVLARVLGLMRANGAAVNSFRHFRHRLHSLLCR